MPTIRGRCMHGVPYMEPCDDCGPVMPPPKPATNSTVADDGATQPLWDREPDPCWSCGGNAEARDLYHVRCVDTNNIDCQVMDKWFTLKTWNTRINSHAALTAENGALRQQVLEAREIIKTLTLTQAGSSCSGAGVLYNLYAKGHEIQRARAFIREAATLKGDGDGGK